MYDAADEEIEETAVSGIIGQEELFVAGYFYLYP
jgi:hypothetical protein